eukprot:CAMPEP_0204148006 /NCGR_PEP_ID=MMETSP0361-20130328/23203_1 /ASSEMBLY_ACC=CAM_ASM_000343 /TAXON_ID=268821 /ORGANISM="Scrippsiella Hangoei, Strain SHTV-5" /LENGTH=49 /DNA_ID= /DNA_START= /DNA_END= /DNA_ORIENTATION=
MVFPPCLWFECCSWGDLLAAAIAVFNDLALSLELVARECGTSPRSLYRR